MWVSKSVCGLLIAAVVLLQYTTVDAARINVKSAHAQDKFAAPVRSRFAVKDYQYASFMPGDNVHCGNGYFTACKVEHDANNVAFYYNCVNNTITNQHNPPAPCTNSTAGPTASPCGAGLTSCGQACYQQCVTQHDANGMPFYYTCSNSNLMNQMAKPAGC